MRQRTAPGASWLRRARHRWWPDGNPLRRRLDRAEAWIAAALIVLFASAGPLSGILAAQWAYRVSEHGQRAEQATWHRVPAVLLDGAPYPQFGAYGGFGLPEARVRWRGPGGAVRHGDIPVSPGAAPGTLVSVWVNRAGQPVSAPLQPRQIAGQEALAAILAPAALAVLLLAAWLLARWQLDRRRLAAWETAWRSAGPTWTSLR